MPCQHVTLPDGTHALVKLSNARARACSVCHRKTLQYVLCDFETSIGPKPKTCDLVLCKACAYHIPPDKDFCPFHTKFIKGEKLPL